MTSLPTPEQKDLQRSSELARQICQEIEASQGTLTFERYMHMCLYTENLGYYTGNRPIFGEQGDFVTSSEKSAFFAKAFVGHLLRLPSQLDNFSIVEIGAGSGRFAAQLLTELAIANISIEQYYIVEKSATLRARQQEYLTAALPAESSLVQWIETLDEPIDNAVVIANEVIDALPVHLITLQKRKIFERCVQWNAENGFSFASIPADKNLTAVLQGILESLSISDAEQSYHTEICLQLHDFVQQIAALVQQGIFFFIDYGYPRAEYYHEQRNMGTLLCHYQNLVHDNPLIWPGLQDISCNVDFTALANAASQSGLELNSYGTQAHFLLASEILTNIDNEISEQEYLRISQQLKQLMLPSEMGERFQVMVFTKHMTLNRDQFTTRDLSHRL